MKEWWNNLGAREKKIFTLGGILVFIFIVYEWMWLPYLDSVAAMRQQIDQGQKTLAWMKTADAQIQKLAGQASHEGGEVSLAVLLKRIQKQINEAGLEKYVVFLKQASDDAISVQFKNVEFDKLLSMVSMLMKAQHIVVTRLVLTPVGGQGSVNADLALGRG